jgi:subtilisin family serine protease
VAADLQTHARNTQQRLLAWADSEDGVRVVNRHWIANAVVLKVRTAEVQPTDITARENVRWLHPNVEIEIPAPVEVNDVSPDAAFDDVTYGLDQINVPDVWDQLGVTGDGAEVAVLDTGINADHPDFGDFDPDNWQEFDGDGQPVDSDPFDDNGHGSHVSGTTAGPLEPDGDDIPTYGVAPDAELWHAKVLDALGGGTFAQIIAGMEWTVDETTADIVGMSLGGGATETTTLEATEHIWDAGLILSASNGNNTLSSPGAYYSSFGSQAIDENDDLAEFAVGEWIEPEEFFDDPDEIPDYWPDEYVTPDASAAGVDVLSLYPDEYAEVSGTSMSQPHKAGVFALMVSASGDIDRDWFWETVNETAWQPEQAPDPDPNAEYGHGIVDALEATQLVALDQNVEGQVTDADDDPIAGAEVTVDDPGSTGQTDDDGFYDVIAAAGDNTVTADAFGFGEVSHDVTVPEEGTATQDFDLPAALDGVVDETQEDAIEAGEAIETTLTVAHPETITVTNDGEYDGALDLVVDGEDAEFGEPVELDEPVGDVDVVVETEADDSGFVELEHTLEGLDDEVVLTTGTTEVHEELFEIGVIDDTEGYGDDWVGILDDELSGVFEVEHVSSDDALEEIEAYDSYFVHGLDAENEDEWFDATDGVGTVYTAQNLGPDTLGQRADVVGDPSSVEIDTGLTTGTVTESHEILEDVAEPGDEIEIHTDTFDDGASFGDTDADVYADAADGNNAFAVDEDRQDVLLTAVGLGWVSEGDHTDDALAVVANAVEYTTLPPEPAAIAVVNDEMSGVPSGPGRDVVDRLESQLEFEYEMALLDGEEAVAAAADGEHDVYVLNHIDPDHVAEFDEHTAGTDAGVVWLDQWGNQGSSAVPSKSDVLGTPEDTDDGRSGGGQNPNLEVVAEHPILEEIGSPGHMVRIHDADRPDHSWFEGYDGDVIGRIQSSSVSDGDGIGVDDETGTVLLSSFGSTRNVAGDDYSAAADTVVGNAVGYLVAELDAADDARPAAPAMTADD